MKLQYIQTADGESVVGNDAGRAQQLADIYEEVRGPDGLNAAHRALGVALHEWVFGARPSPPDEIRTSEDVAAGFEARREWRNRRPHWFKSLVWRAYRKIFGYRYP